MMPGPPKTWDDSGFESKSGANSMRSWTNRSPVSSCHQRVDVNRARIPVAFARNMLVAAPSRETGPLTRIHPVFGVPVHAGRIQELQARTLRYGHQPLNLTHDRADKH